MPDKKSFLTSLISIIFLLAFFTSCEESFTPVGDALLPDSDGLFVKIDTITGLKVKTVLSEGVKSSNNPYPLIGEIKDNYLGELSSTLITQFLPQYISARYSDTTFTFNDAYLILAIDSVIFGDKYSPLTLRISQLLSDPNSINTGLSDTLSCYSNQHYSEFYNYQEKVLLEETIIPSTAIQIDTSENYYYINFPLPESFYLELFNIQNDILADTNFYINDTINGVVVKKYNIDTLFYVNKKILGALAISAYRTDETNGSLIRLDLMHYTGISNNPNYSSKIQVNYTNIGDTALRSFNYFFNRNYYYNFYRNTINNYIYLEHDFAGYPVDDHINKPTDDDTVCFLQNLAGLKTKIEFPDIKEYFSKYDKVVINKAFLKIKEFTPHLLSDTEYSPSIIFGTFESDSYEQLYEMYYDYVDFDGTYNDSLNQYSLNIPHFIQSMVSDNKKNEIYVFPVEISSGNYYLDIYNYRYTILDARSLELIVTYSTP